MLQPERDRERPREREREEVIISESQKLRRLSTRTFGLFEIHCNLMLVKILLSFSSREKDNNVFCVCSGHLNTKAHLGPRFRVIGPECTSKKYFYSDQTCLIADLLSDTETEICQIIAHK